MANMSVYRNQTEHATAFPSNLLAGDWGAHIFNIKLGTDADNGNLVAAGDWAEFDVFNEAAATKFTGKVVQKMPNGNYLVLVTDPGDALLVYQAPITAEEPMPEKYMYNAAGDIVRCYELRKWDRFEASALAFSAEPTVGAAITGVANKKMTVGA